MSLAPTVPRRSGESEAEGRRESAVVWGLVFHFERAGGDSAVQRRETDPRATPLSTPRARLLPGGGVLASNTLAGPFPPSPVEGRGLDASGLPPGVDSPGRGPPQPPYPSREQGGGPWRGPASALDAATVPGLSRGRAVWLGLLPPRYRAVGAGRNGRAARPRRPPPNPTAPPPAARRRDRRWARCRTLLGTAPPPAP